MRISKRISISRKTLKRMRPSCRTPMSLNRAALATPRINEERGKRQKKSISTTPGTKRNHKLPKARENQEGNFHLLLLLRTRQIALSRKSRISPNLSSPQSTTIKAESKNLNKKTSGQKAKKLLNLRWRVWWRM